MYLFGKCLDKKYMNLYLTLKQYFAELKGIVMQDFSATDMDISSLCERYVLLCEKKPLIPRDIQFAMVPVPAFWQVFPKYAEVGEIRYRGQVRGKIFYKRPFEKHCIYGVAWMDKGVIRRTDYYNRYGNISYSIYFDAKGAPVTKSYYDSDTLEMISYDYDTDSFTMYENGRVKGGYKNKDDFQVCLLKKIIADEEKVVVSSLELYRWLVSFGGVRPGNCLLVLDTKEDVLSWDEIGTNQGVNEVDIIREEPIFFIMNNTDTNSLPDETKNKFYRGRYFFSQIQGRKKKSALILTMSDRIESLEELIEAFPNIAFHVAANTAVSDKLANLAKYKNAKIYPQIWEEKLAQLLSECSLYLDINYGYEIYDAIANASMNGLLLCGYESTLHNREYVLKECVFQNKQAMMNFLQGVFDNNRYDELLKCQMEMNARSIDLIMSKVKGEK